MNDKHYAASLRNLQIELVKLQRHFIGCGDCILVIVEGRDGALGGLMRRGDLVVAMKPRAILRDRGALRQRAAGRIVGKAENPHAARKQSDTEQSDDWRNQIA